MISSLLTISMATTDLSLKPVHGARMTFLRYLKVLPVTLPTILYKLTTLTIVLSTLPMPCIFVQYVIVSLCTTLVILCDSKGLQRHVSDIMKLLSLCLNPLTLTLNIIWSSQTVRVQVKLMRCIVWVTFLLNSITLVLCFLLTKEEFWYLHSVHLEYQHTAPWFKVHLLGTIIAVIILGLLSCILTEVYMELAPELILYTEKEKVQTEDSEMAGTRKHGLDNEDTEIEVGLNGMYCKRDEENLCQEQNV